jgi:hypothetical protein
LAPVQCGGQRHHSGKPAACLSLSFPQPQSYGGENTCLGRNANASSASSGPVSEEKRLPDAAREQKSAFPPNTHLNPQRLQSCATYGYFGSPFVFVSRCKTRCRYSVKAEADASESRDSSHLEQCALYETAPEPMDGDQSALCSIADKWRVLCQHCIVP